MIVACTALGDIASGKKHHHQSRTLMTVHPVTVIAHAVHVVTDAALGPRTVPDTEPMWRVVVMTVMRIGVVHPTPVVPFSSKGADVVDQGMW